MYSLGVTDVTLKLSVFNSFLILTSKIKLKEIYKQEEIEFKRSFFNETHMYVSSKDHS